MRLRLTRLTLLFAALFALSGGQPITVSGEWNGEALWPLSVWANDRFVQVSE